MRMSPLELDKNVPMGRDAVATRPQHGDINNESERTGTINGDGGCHEPKTDVGAGVGTDEGVLPPKQAHLETVSRRRGRRTGASAADGCKLAGASLNRGIWMAQTVPTAKLNIAPQNSALKISRLVPSTDLILQPGADLSSWADLTNQPALNLTNLQNEISLPFSSNGGFYRLKTP